MRFISRLGMVSLAMTVLIGAPIVHSAPAVSQTQPRSTSRSQDLALLFKAADKALNVSAFQTESVTQINGSRSGVAANIQFRTQTIVQSPNRFRSEVRVGNETTPRFTIVSDGQTVSIYRADLKQFMTMPYAEFDRRNDNFVIGMSSMLYMMMAPSLKEFNSQGGFDNPALQAQLSAMIPPEVKSTTKRTDFGDLVVYSYPDRQRGFTYELAINPIDSLIKQISLTGNASGFDIVMTETIQRRIVNPKVAGNTFQFTPPKDAKRVNSISLSPF
ncbi:LolA family protein [Leptolyngbya sp. AN03gr2]|uniref:LolA family protein n=1 Tax=unclassified Leptolyngbya TaxID=2650499 RepID=UPI003D317A84